MINIGPEGGSVVAQGTPEQVAKSKKGYTGKFLAEELKGNWYADRQID